MIQNKNPNPSKQNQIFFPLQKDKEKYIGENLCYALQVFDELPLRTAPRPPPYAAAGGNPDYPKPELGERTTKQLPT